ncbi:hypothetical protein CEUSTIGMA_g12301.t1 [Chlamydomonas eustigma]|uniref:C2 domain-containing protein n=1 Tax=Chlamydomonas eustigma TaxID=1157962 RepID=A0A250XQ02_9CHLO|nr:hypothetical protein CEUSTIGMA_g12301.t1 [Chlamydomonas eustigma]|eukprot:GAX84880.1 hypothetical protein CEUSTIGMA_g12301.t1 [Chlamydomonas eustigma]
MKALKKNLNKVANTIDGIGSGIGQSITQVRDKLIFESNDDFRAPPIISSVPSFARVTLDGDTGDTAQAETSTAGDRDEDLKGLSRSTPFKHVFKNQGTLDVDVQPLSTGINGAERLENVVSVFSDETRVRDTSEAGHWWTFDDSNYLCISVREGKGLMAVDHSCNSSSTFVKVKIGDPEVDMLEESETRLCHRNRSPLWAQNFFYPLAGLTPDTRICVSVTATNVGRINILDYFAGQVLTTLGHLLGPTEDIMEPIPRWYKLTRRRPTDKVSGELLLIVAVIPRSFYETVSWSEDPSNLLDPLTHKNLMKGYSLYTNLKELKLLKINMDCDEDISSSLDKLAVELRMGSISIKKPVRVKDTQLTNEGAATRVLTCSFESEVIAFPLDSCFDTPLKKLSRKDRDEVGDFKIYLMHGKDVLAKTQVPVWDIPLLEEDEYSFEDEIPLAEMTSDKRVKSAICKENVDTFLKQLAGIQDSVTNSSSHYSGSVSSQFSADPGVQIQPLATTSANAALPTISSGRVHISQSIPDLIQSSVQKPPGIKEKASSRRSSIHEPGELMPEKSSTFPISGARGGSKLSDIPQAEKSAPCLTGLALARNLLRGEKGRYLYKRSMESYTAVITSSPELVCWMHLGPNKTQQGQSLDEPAGGGAMHADYVTEQDSGTLNEGGLSAANDGVVEPIKLPPNLSNLVIEVLVAGKPDEVFDKCFSAESSFRTRMVVKEGLRDVKLGDWAPDPNKSASTGYKDVKSRSMTYIRPLQIPVPMAPKQCNVTETQWMIAREPGGFVFEKKVSTDGPKCDCFYMTILVTGAPHGSSGTKISASFQIEWIKSAGFLKGAIEGGAISSTKKLWLDLVGELVKELGPPVMTAVVNKKRKDDPAGVITTTPDGRRGDSPFSVAEEGAAPTQTPDTLAAAGSATGTKSQHLSRLPTMSNVLLLLHASAVFLLILLLLNSWIQTSSLKVILGTLQTMQTQQSLIVNPEADRLDTLSDLLVVVKHLLSQIRGNSASDLVEG